MHRGRPLRHLCHTGYAHRTDHAAIVVQVRLPNVHTPIRDHPAESPIAGLLFTARHWDCEGVRHNLRVLQTIELTRLLEVNGFDLFEHASYLDRLRWIVGAVGICMDVDPISQGLP